MMEGTEMKELCFDCGREFACERDSCAECELLHTCKYCMHYGYCGFKIKDKDDVEKQEAGD